MITPAYFPQESRFTCSLAVLRMVLAHYGIESSELELKDQVIPLYGPRFKNIWNPTIAKLACEFGLRVHFEALWPLLKEEQFKKALVAYNSLDEKDFNHHRFENPGDSDVSTEPLPISYAELFAAHEAGCTYAFGGASIQRITKALSDNKLILLTIKLEKLYPNERTAFHSILVYGINKDIVFYHDPSFGKCLSVSTEVLLQSLPKVKPMILFGKH